MTDESIKTGGVVAIVAARDEADRIGETLDALKGSLPGVKLVVADDASIDDTPTVAMTHGAEVISRGKPHGKGGNVNAAAQAILPLLESSPVVLLCDGDLGGSAAELSRLTQAVSTGECELAVATFARRVGGGFGIAVGFAAWAIRRLCGARPTAPISGQRALSTDAFRSVLPLAPGYGMEIGITVDAVRAGYRLKEYELDLEHRATGRTFSGFVHRAKQLRDFTRVFVAKR